MRRHHHRLVALDSFSHAFQTSPGAIMTHRNRFIGSALLLVCIVLVLATAKMPPQAHAAPVPKELLVPCPSCTCKMLIDHGNSAIPFGDNSPVRVYWRNVTVNGMTITPFATASDNPFTVAACSGSVPSQRDAFPTSYGWQSFGTGQVNCDGAIPDTSHFEAKNLATPEPGVPVTLYSSRHCPE